LKSDKFDWVSGAQALFSLVAALGCWTLTLIFVVTGVLALVSPTSLDRDPLSMFLLAAGSALGGFLLLPSAGLALLRLFGRTLELPGWLKWILRPSVLIILFPPALLLGYLATRSAQLAWLLLPPFHILVVGLPILWIVYVARRGLPLGSPQRAWGVFGSGLVLGPGAITVLEILVIGVAAMLAIVYVAATPGLAQELEALNFRVALVGDDPEEILRLLQPYLTSPGILLVIFSFMTIIVPLIEETLKPVGVWLLAGRQLTPGEGFVLGLVSGAGYALYENLAYTTLGSSFWLEVVLLRIGAALLHVGTTAFLGWALVLAWRERRYLRLGVVFVGAVLFHGAWNALALLSAAWEVMRSSPAGPGFSQQVSLAANIGISVLALVMFVLLLSMNHRLRGALPSEVRSEHGLDHPAGQ
jgi:hypothetical protein